MTRNLVCCALFLLSLAGCKRAVFIDNATSDTSIYEGMIEKASYTRDRDHFLVLIKSEEAGFYGWRTRNLMEDASRGVEVWVRLSRDLLGVPCEIPTVCQAVLFYETEMAERFAADGLSGEIRLSETSDGFDITLNDVRLQVDLWTGSEETWMLTTQDLALKEDAVLLQDFRSRTDQGYPTKSRTIRIWRESPR